MYDNYTLEELRDELKLTKMLNKCEGGGYKNEIKILKELIKVKEGK